MLRLPRRWPQPARRLRATEEVGSAAAAEEAIDNQYKAKLKTIPCKLFNFGNGSCPFGSSCCLAHWYTDGGQAGAPELRVALSPESKGEVPREADVDAEITAAVLSGGGGGWAVCVCCGCSRELDEHGDRVCWCDACMVQGCEYVRSGASAGSANAGRPMAEHSVCFALTVAAGLVPSVDRGARTFLADKVAAECARARFYSHKGQGSLPTDFIDSCLGTLEWAETGDAGLSPADLAYLRAS